MERDPGVGDRQTEHAIVYRGDMLGCPGVENGRWFYLKLETPFYHQQMKIFKCHFQLKHAEPATMSEHV